MTNNIDALKKKIQEANPEIMELKFGCEVRFELYPEVFIWVRKLKNGYDQIIKQYTGKITEVPGMTGLIRLGRPIRLADVLLALKEKRSHEFYSADLNTTINVNRREDLELNQITLQFWNLLDDNLDHQSDECKQFLTNLLI